MSATSFSNYEPDPWILDRLAVDHVNEYPTMHYFEIPIHTPSMTAYKMFTKDLERILVLTDYFWKFQ